jgi:cellulose synthase operon protein C
MQTSRRRAWQQDLKRRLSSVLALGLFTSSLTLSVALPVLSQVPIDVREAYTLMDQGLVNQAITVFENAVQRYPQSVEARLGLAIAYRRAGRDADAFATYERVLEIDPNNRLALLSLGILAGFQIEWQDRGIEALTTLLELDPNDTQARAQRALLYGYQGQFGRAIADYEIALQANPTPEVVLGAAQVYAYSGDYELAIDLFNRYQATGGEIRGSAATAYAVALRETGNPEQAAQLLQAELQRYGNVLDGTTIRMRAELAINYAAIGQVSQAESVLAPLQGRRDSRMILSRSYLALARYTGNTIYVNEAIALYEEVLTQEPVYLTVGIGREIADVLTGFPQYRTYALEVYRQLAEQQPNDRSLQIQQASLERELGQISSAELGQRVAAALQPLPSDPYQQKIIAQSLTRLDAPDPVLLPYYQTLLNAGVSEPLLSYRIAQIYVQQNDFAAARSALSEYAATPMGQRESYASELLLAEIDRREGNLEAAAQRYEQVIASNPPDSGVLSGALQGLAGIRQTQGRLPEAIALYDQIIQLNPQDPTKPLGRASLAYQGGLISEAEAEAVLNTWLSTQPLTYTPPELYSLVGALPANPQREPLYAALLQNDPNNIPIQLRQVELIAARDPDAAEAYINELIARDPDNLGAYFVQGQLAQTSGNLRQADRAYSTILSQDPNNVDALAALGGVRFQQRRFTSASRIYNEVLELEPNNRVAQRALIDLTAVQGNHLTALRQLEQLQLQASATGVADAELLQQQQRIEEGFLQQRGFQPPWERY